VIRVIVWIGEERGRSRKINKIFTREKPRRAA